MTTAERAARFSIRVPIAPSFFETVSPRLEMAESGGAPIAQACLDFRTWQLFVKEVGNVPQARPLGGWRVLIELPAARPGMDHEYIPAAAGVRVSHNKGAPTIEFLDEAGRAFAVAEFTPEVFSTLIGECCDLLEIVSKGGLATMPCAGAA